MWAWLISKGLGRLVKEGEVKPIAKDESEPTELEAKAKGT
jgi:hypothetical protein